MKIKKFGLIAVKDGKMLLNRKKGSEFFLLPGGKPEGKESPEDCLRREIREEHNCDVESLKHFGEFEDRAANEDAVVHITAYMGKLKGNPKPGAEIQEQKWFGKDDDPAKLSPILKYRIVPSLIMEGLL